MYPSSQAASLVEMAYKKSTLQSTAERKRQASLMLDFYTDMQTDHLAEDIRKNYRNPDKLFPVWVNVVKKVVRNLAMVYLKDAVRTVDGTQEDQAIFSEIETSVGLSVKMKQVNRLTKLLGTVVMRPVWRGGKMDMDILTPDVLDVATGDTPEQLHSVMTTHYAASGDTTGTTYIRWTPVTVETLDWSFSVLATEQNPYSLLPFVPVWNAPPSDTFWLPGAEDLMSIQWAINRRLTALAYALDYQGYGVGFVRGADMSTDDSLFMGPGSFLTLPAGGEVGFAAPNTPVEANLAFIDSLVKWAAVSNGLPAAALSLDPTEESGVSKIVGNRELEELRRDDVALFTGYERRLFDVFRVVWNTHNPTRPLSESAALRVNFYDPKPSVSPQEQVKEWGSLMELGLLSPVDVLMERDPDLTRDDAKARLLEIRDELKEFPLP